MGWEAIKVGAVDQADWFAGTGPVIGQEIVSVSNVFVEVEGGDRVGGGSGGVGRGEVPK